MAAWSEGNGIKAERSERARKRGCGSGENSESKKKMDGWCGSRRIKRARGSSNNRQGEGAVRRRHGAARERVVSHGGERQKHPKLKSKQKTHLLPLSLSRTHTTKKTKKKGEAKKKKKAHHSPSPPTFVGLILAGLAGSCNSRLVAV